VISVTARLNNHTKFIHEELRTYNAAAIESDREARFAKDPTTAETESGQ
jgi:hypothetical protein